MIKSSQFKLIQSLRILNGGIMSITDCPFVVTTGTKGLEKHLRSGKGTEFLTIKAIEKVSHEVARAIVRKTSVPLSRWEKAERVAIRTYAATALTTLLQEALKKYTGAMGPATIEASGFPEPLLSAVASVLCEAFGQTQVRDTLENLLPDKGFEFEFRGNSMMVYSLYKETPQSATYSRLAVWEKEPARAAA